MNKKFSDGSFYENIKKILEWVVAGITFLTTLVGFVLLLQDNIQLVLVIIFILLSIGSILGLFQILIKKSPPLIIGGSGYYKYEKFRPYAYVGIVLIILINLVFFFSLFKKTYKENNMGVNRLNEVINPTELISTPTLPKFIVTQQLFPTKTQTPSLSINDLIKTNIEFSCDSGDFIIPDSVDLLSPPFDLMENFYQDKVWETWEKESFKKNFTIEITNVNQNNGEVKINLPIYIVLDSYTALDHLNMANFSLFFGWASGSCGGGEQSIYLSKAPLQTVTEMSVYSLDYDYFMLAPGEVEEFTTGVFCSNPGIYQYHLELEASYQGETFHIVLTPTLKTLCPATYSTWYFTGLSDYDFEDDIFTPHSILFVGNYVLQNQIADNSDEDLYKLPYIDEKWYITKPWKPCSDAPESYLFPDQTNIWVKTNPENKGLVNVRSEPGKESDIIARVGSNQSLIINSGPVCYDGLVWWKVDWMVENQQAPKFLSGWVAEGDGIDRWIISCLQGECN